jgi:hypothetical protein
MSSSALTPNDLELHGITLEKMQALSDSLGTDDLSI